MLGIVESLLRSYLFIFIANLCSVSLKGYFLFRLIQHLATAKIAKKIQISSLYLIGVLLSAIIVDGIWLLKITNMFFPSLFSGSVLLWTRIGRAFSVLKYQSLILCMENLINKKSKLTLPIILFVSISTVCFIYLIGMGISHNGYAFTGNFSHGELWPLYILFILTIMSLVYIIWHMHATAIPHILKKQLSIILWPCITSYIIGDFALVYILPFFQEYLAQIFTLLTVLLTYIVYSCTLRIIGLKFLNFSTSYSQPPKSFNFIDRFKDVLEQLSFATTIKELNHITQAFFKDAFNIPLTRTTLYIRSLDRNKKYPDRSVGNKTEALIENFLQNNNSLLEEQFLKTNLFITDEIELNNFYQEEKTEHILIQFLHEINADIFFPLYKDQTIVAAIVVDRHARLDNIYNAIEQDQIIIFGTYLGNIINLLNNKNVESLIKEEKSLKEELYSKHQEINQYKESIRSFLRINQQKEIGVIFYKNRRFIFANQMAKELIPININTQEGHPLAKSLHQLGRHVEEYKSPQTIICTDLPGNRLVLSAVPNLEHHNVIITVYPPEITDIVKQHINVLNDPNKWDYLLYLETTRAGQLINQLIPGSGQSLLHFKIELLKAGLSKKVVLLDIPTDDLIPTVEVLHAISLRETLHVLKLQGISHTHEITQKLFGVNPLFDTSSDIKKPLLEKLDGVGTLFIQNIHFLNKESQEHLVEFIKYGFFRVFKSDQKISSNVRIICSSNHYLPTRIQEGTFDPILGNELKKSTVSMPSLLSLPEHELHGLIEGFTQQLISTHALANLLELTDREKYKLITIRPTSLQELKTRIYTLLTSKAKKSNIYQEEKPLPADDALETAMDPELMQAARLGKQALKDPRIMELLWNKFKNQNTIATFLGVNRSSINRRCKKYNLF